MQTNSILAVVSLAGMLLFSCNHNNNTGTAAANKYTATITTTEKKDQILKSVGNTPEWELFIKPEMQEVIEKTASLDSKETPKLPTITDSSMVLMRENNMAVPATNFDLTHNDIPLSRGIYLMIN